MCIKVDEEGVPLLVQECIIQEVAGDMFNVIVKFFDDSYASTYVTFELLEYGGVSYEDVFKEMWKRERYCRPMI